MPLPWYIKNTIILLGLVLFFHVLIIGKSILIPIGLALLLALLLFPLYKKLVSWNLPKPAAAIVSMLLIFIILFIIFWFISLQVNSISKDLPQITEKVNRLVDRVQSFMESRLGVSPQAQTKFLKQGISNAGNSGSGIFSSAFTATANIITFSFLFVLSLFFFLYYHSFFKEFIFKIFPRVGPEKLDSVLKDVQGVTFNYITGLFIVMVIVGILNTIGLIALGIKHAIFFGMLASFLMIIPFFGILIGSLLPIIYALVTKDSLLYPVAVAGVFWFVQLLEANLITPNIVGGKVKLNPYATIIALFVGGAVWGGAGMIMFIPFFAMLKVIFDAYPPLKPYAFVFGEPQQEHGETLLKKAVKKLKGK